MADPLSCIGGLAAGMQLLSTASRALLATIRLVRDLKDIPEKLALLLGEVEDSISRLCQSCNAGSRIFQNLDRPQLNRLSRSTAVLYTAMQEIYNILVPLVYKSKGRGASIRGLWQLFVSLKVERRLSQKLERLNGLNIEMIRELGMIGLEFQVTTNELVVASSASSKEAFSKIEAKMDSLHDDFDNFTLWIHQMHANTVENPEDQSIVLIESSLLSGHKLSGKTQCSTSNSDKNSNVTPESMSCTQDLAKEGHLSREKAEQMRRYLAGGSGIGTTSALNVLSTSQFPSADLEFVLYSIRTFYTTGNFDASSTITKPEFWNNTDLAIYMMKVSAGSTRGSIESQTRGLRLLENLTANNAKYTLDQSTASILIELLSTLSPVNTSTCPYVRNGLLRHLSKLAGEQLPHGHPITLVINNLKDGNRDKYISLCALTFIVERLSSTLGPVHELTRFATDQLCALLRRSGDYSEGLRVAQDGIRSIRSVMGPGSLPERKLLRHVEHVHMDQRDWVASLSTCFDIVGQQQQQQLDVPNNPDPLYHDECAVYTMEDIAKTCECAGNREQAVAWLKQARISGGMLWGRTEALVHIQDKLHELLREMRRGDELEIWSKTLDAEDMTLEQQTGELSG